MFILNWFCKYFILIISKIKLQLKKILYTVYWKLLYTVKCKQWWNSTKTTLCNYVLFNIHYLYVLSLIINTSINTSIYNQSYYVFCEYAIILSLSINDYLLLISIQYIMYPL